MLQKYVENVIFVIPESVVIVKSLHLGSSNEDVLLPCMRSR